MNWIKEQSQTYPALSWSKSHIYLSRLSSSNVISINVFSFLFTVSTASFSFALLCLPVRRLQGKEKLSTSLHIHILCCAHGVSSLLFCFSRANPGWVQDNYPFHRDAVRVICYVRRSDNQHKSDSSNCLHTGRYSATHIHAYIASMRHVLCSAEHMCSVPVNQGKSLRQAFYGAHTGPKNF